MNVYFIFELHDINLPPSNVIYLHVDSFTDIDVMFFGWFGLEKHGTRRRILCRRRYFFVYSASKKVYSLTNMKHADHIRVTCICNFNLCSTIYFLWHATCYDVDKNSTGKTWLTFNLSIVHQVPNGCGCGESRFGQTFSLCNSHAHANEINNDIHLANTLF